MTAVEESQDVAPTKSGKKGLLIGLVLALVAGGGGFYATYSGKLSFLSETQEHDGETQEDDRQSSLAAEYIRLDPILVTIRSSQKYRVLRLGAQLQVSPDHQASVAKMTPRIVDAMNTYLNALDAKEFEDQMAIIRVRSQLLRRAKLITGSEKLQDILITEFVLQ